MLSRWSRIGHLLVISLVISAVLACAGCEASTKQWTKAGATEQQLAQDLQTCNKTAAQWGAAPYFDPRRGQIISGPQDASQTPAACMMRRGWTLAP
jgi:hypothetical protein